MSRSWILPVAAALAIAAPSPVSAQCLNWDARFAAPNGPNGEVNALIVFDDGSGPALYVGGDFSSAGGQDTKGIARWNGSAWSSVGGGVTTFGSDHGEVYSLAVHDDGTGPALFVGGLFNFAGGVPARRIAKWDGSTWTALGSGLDTYWPAALASYDDGNGPDLYAGGRFLAAGGTLSPYLAKWDGSAWSTTGPGVNDAVAALAVFDAGSGPALFAGGNMPAVLEWTGSAWVDVASGTLGQVLSMAVFDDGSGPALYVAGSLYSLGGMSVNRVAKWTGSTWSDQGNGIDGLAATVRCLAVFDDGDGSALYAGGIFATQPGLGGLAEKWDGDTWSSLGSGPFGAVNALAVFDEGVGAAPGLYTGGDFTGVGTIGASHLSAWRGCSDPIDTFCFGDGSVAPCLCAEGTVGRGCQNSQLAGGAVLAASGGTNPDTVVLQTSGEPTNALTVFFQGDALITASTFAGNGLRCSGGQLRRLYAHQANGGASAAPAAGDPSITVRSAALGDSIAPGETRYYQAIYRDPDPNFCPVIGATFNITNGVRIRW